MVTKQQVETTCRSNNQVPYKRPQSIQIELLSCKVVVHELYIQLQLV